MSGQRHIPAETIEKQALAATPSLSAWVSAHAGSGKTHVLSQRVVRLLLDGCEPSKVLCLTYTRAAAANMANRVFRDLATWALMDDAKLGAAIEKMTGRPAGAEDIADARRLFARALETPGGLKIQTIHAFCEAVLQQFPLEANIAGHFEMLDAQQEAALLAEARRDMITGAAGGMDAGLASAFADVLQIGGESGLDNLLGEIVRRRDGLRAFIAAVEDGQGQFTALFEEFGFAEDETAETIVASGWPLPGFDRAYVDALREAVSGIAAARFADDIVPHLLEAFAEADPIRRFELAAKGMLTSKGEAYGKSALTKGLVARLPDLPDRYAQACDAIIATRDRLALFRMVAATRSALTIADWLIGRYERIKRARGFLDFNDLISRTAALLSRDEASAWVQYKLDQGIDHILIDEAQDTSPEQWQVVKKLAAEFFAGRGARDNVTRTIFAVGDEKQSIYSFQGAEPAAFADSGQEFSASVEAASARFEKVNLTRSFRSTDDVLKAVDLVFADDSRRKGLTRDPEHIAHDGVRTGEPGYVELWSSLGPEEAEEPDDWTQPVDHASAPAVRLAETIADTIHGWIGSSALLEGKGRPVKPGDILVLVRKRGSFVHALTRALKDAKRNIRVAGADRLTLTGHIAVKDLLAIARFVQQPQDDLSLAALMRSPVFGLTDEELFDLAHGRGRATLFEAIQEAAEGEPKFAEIVSTLEDWRNAAAFQPVFEFYAGLLAGKPGRIGLRARLVARLGEEAGDVIDEFLSFCMALEQTGGDGLEALLAALDETAPEIKREMDQSRDEVRIMTVHASKGLEAPVVFLVDPGSEPFHAQHMPTLIPFQSRQKLWPGDGYLWRAGSGSGNPFARDRGAEIKDAAEDEYRRLLYVGMTRAEDRLIVCGYHGVRGRPDVSWHAMVEEALTGSDHTEELDQPAACAPVLRFRITQSDGVEKQKDKKSERAPLPALPEGLKAALPPAPEPPRALRPSGTGFAVDDDAQPPQPAGSPVLVPDLVPSLALARGTAIHRLLQLLPAMQEDARAAAMARYLDHAGRDWPEAEREKAAAAVAAILADPSFAPVFAPNSRAEVSVMGKVEANGRTWSVSGKIDRLAVTDGDVLIVDYKTGRAVPATEADIPPNYVAQLAIYRALLQPVYPDKRIRAGLLFTESPILFELAGERLDAALETLTGP